MDGINQSTHLDEDFITSDRMSSGDKYQSSNKQGMGDVFPVTELGDGDPRNNDFGSDVVENSFGKLNFVHDTHVPPETLATDTHSTKPFHAVHDRR